MLTAPLRASLERVNRNPLAIGFVETLLIAKMHAVTMGTAMKSPHELSVHINRNASPLFVSPQMIGAAPCSSSSTLSPQALHRAIDFLTANLTERFTLDDLANKVGLSRFHFARLFRATTGHAPMHYLMRMRIEHSKPVLVQGECSICEVAAQFGFCDQSHFTRTFRRVAGCAPSEFILRTKIANYAGEDD